MAREGYTGVTLKQELADRLEAIRKDRGHRSIPETIESLVVEVGA